MNSQDTLGSTSWKENWVKASHYTIPYLWSDTFKEMKTTITHNGKEFPVTYFYNTHVILYQRSCVETLQINAVVERKYRHILNVTREITFQCSLPKVFSNYVVIHDVFLINKLPHMLASKYSYEILHNTLYWHQNLWLSRLSFKYFTRTP